MMKWMMTDESVFNNRGWRDYKQWKTSHTTQRENIQTRLLRSLYSARSTLVVRLSPLLLEAAPVDRSSRADVLVMVFHLSRLPPGCDFQVGGRYGRCSNLRARSI